MKNQVSPVVAIVIVVAAVALAIAVGFRAVNSTPKLTYPKGFNPAAPPGASKR